MKLKYVKKYDDNYITLKQVLKEEFHLSSRLILKLKTTNNILVNDSLYYLDKKLVDNDKVTVTIDFDEDNSNILSTKINLNILYEDEDILIIDKPAGIPVHPSGKHYDDSLSNGIKYYFDMMKINKKIRPVNRLDRNTSGIVIFAKNQYIQECLSKEMQNKTFKKEYIAVCKGIFEKSKDTINAPISRKETSIIERCVSDSGSTAITHYSVIKQFDNMAELLVNLETGKTHQIRVHMAYIGHPIVGDSLYGTASNLINRQALHAYRVNFIHPINKKNMEITAPIPSDIQKLIDS